MTRRTIRLALVLGTRPEAIKLAPLAVEMQRQSWCEPVIVATGQHPELAEDALAIFDLAPHVALQLSRRPGEGMPELYGDLIRSLAAPLRNAGVEAVVVQGDTATAVAGALAGYLLRLPVVHLEAGLRTGDDENPFPEEANRRLIAQLARLHLAPLVRNADALVAEGIDEAAIAVVGNTVVDAALAVADSTTGVLPAELASLGLRGRLILCTAHRRESWDKGIEATALALAEILSADAELEAVVVSHPNPKVRSVFDRVLGGVGGAVVVGPMPYPRFLALLARADVVITDSGGVSEEAPLFGTAAVLTRVATERAEALELPTCVLVAPQQVEIVAAVRRLLDDDRPSSIASPFGDGHASQRAAEAIRRLVT